MMFTVEEITLMKMYTGFTPNRQTLIRKLKTVIPQFTDEEQEMKDLTGGVIRKLTAMNDKSFVNIDFSLALDEEVVEE
ncbi:MAG: transposon-transfer assisting family protein [Desulfosporosinus sp.]